MRKSLSTIASLLGAALFCATVSPGAAQAQSAPSVPAPRAIEKDRHPVQGVGNAFRTAGSGVVYGTRSVGRAVTGRRHTPEGRYHELRERARMEHRARQTRRDFRGY